MRHTGRALDDEGAIHQLLDASTVEVELMINEYFEDSKLLVLY